MFLDSKKSKNDEDRISISDEDIEPGEYVIILEIGLSWNKQTNYN